MGLYLNNTYVIYEVRTGLDNKHRSKLANLGNNDFKGGVQNIRVNIPFIEKRETMTIMIEL